MELHKALKAAREKAGVTQDGMAKEMGYKSAQIVSNWERGVCDLPLKKARKFCKIVNMELGALKKLILTDYEASISRYFEPIAAPKPKVSKKEITATQEKV